jgi:hypothetical protein
MLMKILVVFSLILLCSSPSCLSQEISDAAPKAKVLEADAVDFIRAESPSVKIKLRRLPDEASRQQLIRSFVETISGMYLYPDIAVEGKKEAESLLNEEMRRLDSVDDWESRAPKLSKAQECARDLYSKIKGEWGDPYLADSWLSKLDINNGCGAKTIQCLNDDFRKYGVLRLRSLVSIENPKLVIGCGNRVNTEPSRTYRPNPHLGDDTVDPNLRRNPSIVGFFGGPSIFPDNHYQTIFDEVPLRDINVSQWKEAERILKPGGFYIAPIYIQGAKLPKGSKLRLHSVIGNTSRFSCPSRSEVRPLGQKQQTLSRYQEKLKLCSGLIVFSKPKIDGTFPEKIQQEDLPSGVDLVEQRRVTLPDEEYIHQ